MDKNFFASLIDSCVEGNLTFDDITVIKQNIDAKNSISGWYAKNAFHDLATLRYRFTMEVVVSTVLYYLTRPRSTSKKALKNFKLAKQLLDFIVEETGDLVKNEARQNEEEPPKRRRPKKKRQDLDKPEQQEEEGEDGTNS
jgi:hypothetical protein